MDYNITNFIEIQNLNKTDLENLLKELKININENTPAFIKENLINSYTTIDNYLKNYTINIAKRSKILITSKKFITQSIVELSNSNINMFLNNWKNTCLCMNDFNLIFSQSISKRNLLSNISLINSEMSKNKDIALAFTDERFRTYISTLLKHSLDIIYSLETEINIPDLNPTIFAPKFIEQYIGYIHKTYTSAIKNEHSSLKNTNEDYSKRVYVLGLSNRKAYFKFKNNILVKATEEEILSGNKVPISSLKDEDTDSGRSMQASKSKEWEF